MTADIQTTSPAKASRVAGTHADVGAGPSIAVVTSVPGVTKILTGGLDPYGLNRRTISKLDMQPFLDKNGIEGLDVELFFVPALIDEWSQYDEGYLRQLVNALSSGKHFDQVINIGQAVPLYRRYRPKNYETKSALVDAAVQFANTLSALASLPRILEGKILEPRAFDRTTYSFNTSQFGEVSVIDMEVSSEWIEEDDRIWAGGTPIGLSDLSDLAIPAEARDAAGPNDTYGGWLDELKMGPLAERFIYSDFKLDYDDQVERLWIANEQLLAAGESPFLLDTTGVRNISDAKLKKRMTSSKETLTDAEIQCAEIADAFATLSRVVGDQDDLRMLDVSTVLQLDDFGVAPRSPKPKYGRDALTLLKKFPFSVAFQKMWDRQSKLYEESELNGKVNAWHVANTLLHAKMELQDAIPSFIVWVVPVMPTNSVRFIMDPKRHNQNIENTLINAFSALAQQQVVRVTSL